MERAASFRSLYWFGKPRPISAMECARRGWRCYAKDTLECSLCGAKLVFALPEAAATAIGGEALMASAVQEFLGKLSSEHRAGCKWKEQVCPENLNSLPAISDSEIKVISLIGVLDYASAYVALVCICAIVNNCGTRSSQQPAGEEFGIYRDYSKVVPTLCCLSLDFRY